MFLSKEGKIGFEDGKSIDIAFPYEINFQNKSADSLELSSFTNYLYVFDKEHGEIIKYPFSQDKIGSGALWLNQRQAAKETSSIAIDGNIHLLKSDGGIQRFTGGVLKEEITSPKTFPKITKATKIFTSPSNKYIYLLEPAEKRVIVIDKKGNLIVEYQSPEFENLKDVWASPQDTKIYLLCGSKTSTENNLTNSSIITRVFEVNISQ